MVWFVRGRGGRGAGVRQVRCGSRGDRGTCCWCEVGCGWAERGGSVGDELGGQGGRCSQPLGVWGRTAVPAPPPGIARAGKSQIPHPPWLPLPSPAHPHPASPSTTGGTGGGQSLATYPALASLPTPWLHGGTILAGAVCAQRRGAAGGGIGPG